MGKSGFDVSGLKKFQKELEKLKDKAEPFAEDCAKELGKRVLTKVIKRTPTGDYKTEIQVTANGKTLTLTLVNPVEYASYVEYGHVQTPGRYVPAIGKRLKKGFVQGHFKRLRRSTAKVA